MWKNLLRSNLYLGLLVLGWNDPELGGGTSQKLGRNDRFWGGREADRLWGGSTGTRLYHGLDYMYGSISSVTEWFHTGIVCHNMSTHPQWTVSSRDWTHIGTIWTSKADELPGPSKIKFKFKFKFYLSSIATLFLSCTDSEILELFYTNSHFLADRTNGRAIATLLRLSSVVVVVCRRLWRYVLWLNGAS